MLYIYVPLEKWISSDYSGPGINNYIMRATALWVATLTQLCWARERNDGHDAPARRQTAIRPTYVIANTCT